MISTGSRIMKHRKSLSLIFLITVISIVLGIGGKIAFAAPIIDFKPGHIIDDTVFTNTSSMSQSQIQSFLNNKVPVCDTWGSQTSEYGGGTRLQWAQAHGYSPPFTCLKDYVENGKPAAQIITETAQEFSINPQVLIVLLQKEQGLVTDTWPVSGQYRSATGYGCPDTAPCDSQYYGFTNQLYRAAKMFRSIMNNDPSWYTPYTLGNNFIRWSPDASCGGGNVFIENRSTQALYNYTPYQPNQAALSAGYGQGDSCSAYGNRNFYLYFRDWFGYNAGPAAFKTSDSSTVYIPIENYKIAVSSMALLQDYGVAANAIQTVSQSYLDSRSNPPTELGISTSLSYVIKSPDDTDEDGGCLYLISRGKRYQFQSMAQLYSFGFTESDISYIPLGNIFSIPSGGLLQNFVTAPNSQEVFKVANYEKSIYFKYSDYISDNPSDSVTPFSYYLLDRLTSELPISSGTSLVKLNDSAAIYLYDNNKYYLAPDYSTFSDCWRLDRELSMPLYVPSQNSYIPPINSSATLSCLVNDGTNDLLLSDASELTLPPSYGIAGTLLNSDLVAFLNRLPGHSRVLKQYIKSPSDASVWYLESGAKRLIPSYSNFKLMGLTDGSVDVVNSKSVDSIPVGLIKLAVGQLVKTPSSASVYVISGDARMVFPSSELFNAYGNPWGGIETYSDSLLDTGYPNNGVVVSSYLVDTTKSSAYIVSPNSCYILSQPTLDALGQSYSSLASLQTYPSSIFKYLNVSGCTSSSLFLKHPGSPLVYWLDGGVKHPLNSYSAMLSKNGGQVPVIMDATDDLLSSITTGSTIY